MVVMLFVLVIHQSNQFFAQTIAVDPNLPDYKKVIGISGNANSIGSDTMNNLMALWLEEFKNYYPLVNIQIEGKRDTPSPWMGSRRPAHEGHS